MVKLKKNRVDSDALLKKKSLHTMKKPNRFEIQTSRSKFTILNRDTQKNRYAGIPGTQRAKAIEKRKQTLGKEFLHKYKSNRFTDQRKDGQNMNRDQLASERQSMSSRRKEMFNLNDTIKLTHRGQTLEEIERFDDAVDSDGDSEEDGGQLEAEFMEAAHFGGGEAVSEERGKDRKTVIEEMIAESKRRKAEKQRENDEVYEMTQKLDKNWQSLVSVVGDHMKGDTQRPQLDDYDKVMREMIFERRGKPADKLKSEAELARSEIQKLENLERERLARMKGENADKSRLHRSADDLDDGYILQPVDGNEEAAGYDTDVDVEDGLYNPREISKEAKTDENINEVKEEADSSSDSDGEESHQDNDRDDLSDLKEDSESEKESLQNTNKLELVKVDPVVQTAQEDRKIADEELPFTFELPRKYEQFQKLLNQRSPHEQISIVARLMRFNRLKFSQEIKSKMLSLFAFLLQHLNDLFVVIRVGTIRDSFIIMHELVPYLCELIRINPVDASSCFREVLKEKVYEYRQQPRRYPKLDSLIFLKLVPVLFSASDFRHPVVTPAMLFISAILSRCQVRTRADVTSGLFLATIALECTEQSKRFLPATLNFINGILYLCFRKRSVQLVPVVPPFKSTPPLNNLLALDETMKNRSNNDFSLHAEDFIIDEVDDSFKLRSLSGALGLINKACHQLKELPALHQISHHWIQNLERLDGGLFPAILKVELNETLNNIKILHNKPLFRLVSTEQKPKPLRLLEPKIETVYDDIQRRPKNQQQADKEKRRKLQQKVKRESRAAIREIRQDNEFIAKLQFKQRAADDRERNNRVRRIFSDATTQQGELKSLDRKAKYKK